MALIGLENIVFCELLRRNLSVYYFSQKKECDFLTFYNNKITTAIQVSWTITNDKTAKREINGLIEACETYKLNKGYIITESEYDNITIGKINVLVRPFWLWALEQE